MDVEMGVVVGWIVLRRGTLVEAFLEKTARCNARPWGWSYLKRSVATGGQCFCGACCFCWRKEGTDDETMGVMAALATGFAKWDVRSVDDPGQRSGI